MADSDQRTDGLEIASAAGEGTSVEVELRLAGEDGIEESVEVAVA